MRSIAVIVFVVLAACGGAETEVVESETIVSPDGYLTVSEGTSPAPASSASNANFAQLIAATGVPQRCINLASWAGERTPQDRALAGLLEFNADPYVNPAPSWIAELAKAGFLKHEGQSVTNNNPVNVYRPTPGNGGMFRWVETGTGRGGEYHFCPGQIFVKVVSYTEPAEERGITEVRYSYRVSDIPAPIQGFMDSGLIPSGPPRFNEIRGTLLVEGESEATFFKTNNGWEVSQGRRF